MIMIANDFLRAKPVARQWIPKSLLCVRRLPDTNTLVVVDNDVGTPIQANESKDCILIDGFEGVAKGQQNS